MSDEQSNTVRILTYPIDEATLKTLDNRRRNQLFGCMHAHNELSYLNRLLLFTQNATADGELHDHAQSIQMWCTLQILAGKLFETWRMLADRILRAKPADPIIAALCPDHQASLGFLGNCHRARKLKRCRELLGMAAPIPADPPADYRDRYQALTGQSLRECPHCRTGIMVVIGGVARPGACWCQIHHEPQSRSP